MSGLHIESLRGKDAGAFAEILAPLLAESEAEGFRHVRRLCEDYASGANRFEAAGEELFSVFDGETLVGVGGLNAQTADESGERIGRVRRLYVLPAYRRRGVGRAIMAAILAAGRRDFDAVVLRTHNPEADVFYLALGFNAAAGETVTHRLDFRPGDG